MRDDNYISSKRDIRNRRYRQRRRQVILNRFIFGGILIILVLLGVIFIVKACRDDAAEKGNNNSQVQTDGENKTPSGGEKDTANEPDTTPETPTEHPTEPPTTGDKNGYKNDGKRIVCIDPGHGGKDGGSEGSDGTLEKDDNLKMALALRDALQSRGITVYMTRDDDSWVELKDRPLYSNSVNADCLISVHRNEYAADSSVRGFEAWVHSAKPADSVSLATKLQKALVNAGISRDRGVKYGSQTDPSTDYAVNNHSNAPSCLLELGFMTNAGDNENFRNNTKNLAEAMADAIVEWMDTQGL